MKGFHRPIAHAADHTIPKKHMRHWFWRHHQDFASFRLAHHWPGERRLHLARVRSILWLTRHLWPRWWKYRKADLAAQEISAGWLLGPLQGSDWREFRWMLFFGGGACLNVGIGVSIALRHDWPWPLFSFAAALVSLSFAVITFQRWRKTWDSPKPPTSKSSPLSQAQSISQMFNVPPSLLASLSLSASPSRPSPYLFSGYTPWGGSSLPVATGPLTSQTVDMPVVGYRSWTVTPRGIRSINEQGGDWLPGVNRAECKRSLAASFGLPLSMESHRTPDARCACGLYGWHQPSHDDREMTVRVMGAVLAWGRIIRHGQQGFRAEYMRPICLARPEREDYRSRDKTGPMCEKVIITGVGVEIKDVPWRSDYEIVPGTFHCVAGKSATCIACGATVLKPMTDLAWDVLLTSREDLADSLKLPLVPIEHLETYAREFGQSIKELQPKELPPGDEIKVGPKPDGVSWSEHVYRLLGERRVERLDFRSELPTLRFSSEDYKDMVRSLGGPSSALFDPHSATIYGCPVIVDP